MGNEENQNALNLILELEKKRDSLTKEVYWLGVKFDSLTKKVNEATLLRDSLKTETESYKTQRRDRRKLLKEMLFKFRKVSEKLILQNEEFVNLKALTENEVQNIEEAKKEKEKTLLSIQSELDTLSKTKANLKDKWLTLSDYQASLDAKLSEIENEKNLIASQEIRIDTRENKVKQVEAETEKTKALANSILDEAKSMHEEAKSSEARAKELEAQAEREVDSLKGQQLLIEAQKQLIAIESVRLESVSKDQETERERIASEWKSVEFMKEHAQNKKLQVMKILHDKGLDDVLEMVKEIK